MRIERAQKLGRWALPPSRLGWAVTVGSYGGDRMPRLPRALWACLYWAHDGYPVTLHRVDPPKRGDDELRWHPVLRFLP